MASIAMVFAPYAALAFLPQAKPPLPPPITKKSHSFCMGAMAEPDVPNCRDTAESLCEATLIEMFAAGKLGRRKEKKGRARVETGTLTDRRERVTWLLFEFLISDCSLVCGPPLAEALDEGPNNLGSLARKFTTTPACSLFLVHRLGTMRV